MTNAEKFTSWKERSKAFEDFCNTVRYDEVAYCPICEAKCACAGWKVPCAFKWLEMDSELVKKPIPKIKSEWVKVDRGVADWLHESFKVPMAEVERKSREFEAHRNARNSTEGK